MIVTFQLYADKIRVHKFQIRVRKYFLNVRLIDILTHTLAEDQHLIYGESDRKLKRITDVLARGGYCTFSLSLQKGIKTIWGHVFVQIRQFLPAIQVLGRANMA